MTEHSALLNATINPCGSPVRVTFQADMRAIPSDTYRMEIVPENAVLPADHQPHRVSVRLNDLERVQGQAGTTAPWSSTARAVPPASPPRSS